MLRTGAPWRDLPERYGPWQTCATRFRRWTERGVWERALQALQARAERGGDLGWAVAALDGSYVKADPHAAGAPKRGPRPRRAKPGRRSGAAGAG